MQEVRPYRTVAGMARALDNGGRFYNVLTKAGDDVVTGAELAKLAGTWSSGQSAFLFMEMARRDLPEADKKAILRLLDGDLKRGARKYRPLALRPSDVEAHGRAGRSAIVEGYPRFIQDRTQFTGFIMIPMTANNVTTFLMVPIYDRFDVYEVFDDRRRRKPNSVIATTRGVKFSPDDPIRFGGVLKKLEFKDETARPHSVYLETLYYTRLA